MVLPAEANSGQGADYRDHVVHGTPENAWERVQQKLAGEPLSVRYLKDIHLDLGMSADICRRRNQPEWEEKFRALAKEVAQRIPPSRPRDEWS
jgi:hypothetical protein